MACHCCCCRRGQQWWGFCQRAFVTVNTAGNNCNTIRTIAILLLVTSLLLGRYYCNQNRGQYYGNTIYPATEWVVLRWHTMRHGLRTCFERLHFNILIQSSWLFCRSWTNLQVQQKIGLQSNCYTSLICKCKFKLVMIQS